MQQYDLFAWAESHSSVVIDRAEFFDDRAFVVKYWREGIRQGFAPRSRLPIYKDSVVLRFERPKKMDKEQAEDVAGTEVKTTVG